MEDFVNLGHFAVGFWRELRRRVTFDRCGGYEIDQSGEQVSFWQIFLEVLVKVPIFITQSKNSANTLEYFNSCHVIRAQLGYVIRCLATSRRKPCAQSVVVQGDSNFDHPNESY